jgi:hypothetical protein
VLTTDAVYVVPVVKEFPGAVVLSLYQVMVPLAVDPLSGIVTAFTPSPQAAPCEPIDGASGTGFIVVVFNVRALSHPVLVL